MSRITIPKSKPLSHPPSDVWWVKKDFEIVIWHIATIKNTHIVRFGIDDRQFEVYFYKSGRIAHIFPVKGEKKS